MRHPPRTRNTVQIRMRPGAISSILLNRLHYHYSIFGPNAFRTGHPSLFTDAVLLVHVPPFSDREVRQDNDGAEGKGFQGEKVSGEDLFSEAELVAGFAAANEGDEEGDRFILRASGWRWWMTLLI